MVVESQGNGLPVDHRMSLGMVGMHGTVEANRALMNADLVQDEIDAGVGREG